MHAQYDLNLRISLIRRRLFTWQRPCIYIVLVEWQTVSSLFLMLCSVAFDMGKYVIAPFHWTAIPLRFETLVKMPWVVAKTATLQKRQHCRRNVLIVVEMYPTLHGACFDLAQILRSGMAVDSKQRSNSIARYSWTKQYRGGSASTVAQVSRIMPRFHRYLQLFLALLTIQTVQDATRLKWKTKSMPGESQAPAPPLSCSPSPTCHPPPRPAELHAEAQVQPAKHDQVGLVIQPDQSMVHNCLRDHSQWNCSIHILRKLMFNCCF